MKFDENTLREVYDLEKLNIIKSFVSLNLKEAVKYGIENGLDNARGWLKIIDTEFLIKPIYVDCLSASIARMIYIELQPGLEVVNNEGLQEKLQNRIAIQDLARRVLYHHSLAYANYVESRNKDEKKLSR